MAEQFGHADILQLYTSGSGYDYTNNPYLALGASVPIEFIGNLPILGPLLTFTFTTKPEIFYGPTSQSELPFLFNQIGGILQMANIIAKGDSSSIEVNELKLTDETGAGPCNLSGPTGSFNRITSIGPNLHNITGTVTLIPENSFNFYTNINAPTITQINLPSGVRPGFMAGIFAAGQPIRLSPISASDRIFIPGSGFKAQGQVATISGSGSHCILIAQSGSWLPFAFNGSMV